jgi:Icc protein
VRIHQITDLHIPDDESDERFGHVLKNVRRQFLFIEFEKPDLLVISGDLTMNDYSEASCLWIKLNLPDVPVVVIPGNHDDPAMINRIFGAWQSRIDYDDCTLIFLDTSSDRLPPSQLEFLANVRSEKQCALFIHHPPHLIGSGFMSLNQPLLNHADVARSIGDSAVNFVFCGHLHNEAHLSCKDFELFLTPSPAFQIAIDQEQFTMEEFRPSVRKIDINADGVSSELVYV